VASSNGWKLSEAKSLDKGELDRIFLAARKDDRRSHIMIMLAYNGALSVSELIHIKVDSFNFGKRTVIVIPIKKIPGGPKEPVDYPLPSNVIVTIQKYVTEQDLKKRSYLFPGRAKKSCMVVGLDCPGGHISKREVQGIFDRICQAANLKLPGRGIHTLRHARLIEVAEKTRDPWVVRQAGRFQSIAMSGHYMRFVEEIGGRV